MIIGIGVDTVDLNRFEKQLNKTPKLKDRLFTEAERALSVHSLAARFAAKESLIKAFGDSDGLKWHDIEVSNTRKQKPQFVLTAALRSKLAILGARQPHLSMTHDGNIATAFVVLEKI